MSMTNFIQFIADDIDTATGSGLISTIDRDLDIKVMPFDSANENAPTHRVYANLGRYPGQDDTALQAIIEWEPRA